MMSLKDLKEHHYTKWCGIGGIEPFFDQKQTKGLP
jgi:hypothetical protein